jgi:hypothetical protein
MKRTKEQRTAYALRRLSKAVDRHLIHPSEQTRKWINAWAWWAGVRRGF